MVNSGMIVKVPEVSSFFYGFRFLPSFKDFHEGWGTSNLLCIKTFLEINIYPRIDHRIQLWLVETCSTKVVF